MVIAIIAILAGLLLPALASAKRKAAGILDLNNQKQLLSATIMYAGDNEDRMVWANWGNPEGVQGWAYQYVGALGIPARFALTNSALYEYFGKNTNVLVCPMDYKDPSIMDDYSGGNPRGRRQYNLVTSYCMNGSGAGYQGYGSSRMHMRLTKFQSADDIIYWEQSEDNGFYFNDGGNYPDEGISTRHIGSALVGSIGGHAEFMKIDVWERIAGNRLTGAARPSIRTRAWNNPFTADGH